jgi:hypothetical protein
VLFHLSIPADDPERGARIIAEVCGGSVLPFLPVPGAFMVWLGDERRTIIEVNPRGHEHVPAAGQFAIRQNSAPSPYSEGHIAIGTRLSADRVLGIGRREGWMAQSSDRGGLFTVVELWLENKFLLEVLTDAEQQRYVANLTLERLHTQFGLTPSRGTAI